MNRFESMCHWALGIMGREERVRVLSVEQERRRAKWKLVAWGLVGFVATFSTLATVAFLSCWMEARTFNKYRGEGQPAATVLDAFFSQLRVETRSQPVPKTPAE